MAVIRPFPCVHPKKELAYRVAALPYDVFNREEAKREAKKDPYSFLNIDRPETQFDDSIDLYDDRVYKKARQLYEMQCKDRIYEKDQENYYYLYELIMNGRSQTGIVACASIDDYINGTIMKHENTREEKEQDRIRHVDTMNAQTGPIFLAYRYNQVLHDIIANEKKKVPFYSFTALDGVMHNVWQVSDRTIINKIEQEFQKIQQIYIADGHHRAASAVKVGQKRRKEHPFYTGEEEFNYFLSVLFTEDELMILPYNRVVKDLNGRTKEQFFNLLTERFSLQMASEPVEPKQKGCFGMYLDHTWYTLTARPDIIKDDDPVESLDVSILQKYVLNPILGIKDPRTDQRIDFIGGIRGLSELERRANTDMKLAFSVYPTSMKELFSVADAKRLMPPKSTWFEPKLRSGLFIHELR